jgi:hypothetical protein
MARVGFSKEMAQYSQWGQGEGRSVDRSTKPSQEMDRASEYTV